MTYFTTSLIIGWLILFAISCTSPSDSSNQDDYKANEHYTRLLKKGLDHGLPGMILAVQRGREKTWIGAAGLSDIERQTPLNTEDRFHLASVTKLFTSVAILKLVDEKKLKIDDKAIQYLDSILVGPIPYINQIEIGQLLDHSSGIYSFNNDLEYLETLIGKRIFPKLNWSTDQLVTLAYGDRVQPQGKPGTGHYYSDTNLVLLALVIEKISGRPFRQFIKKNLFEPLDLNDTGFYSDVVNERTVELNSTVQGYLKRSKELDEFIEIHPSFKEVAPGLVNTTSAGENIDAAAGIVSTAGDVMKFGSALYKGNLLSSESLNWLLSIGKDIELEDVDTKRQGIVSVRNKVYGVLFTSLGDGVGGMNTMLAYHPDSETIVLAFTNIFGNFDEHDFFMDVIVSSIVGETQN